MEEAGVQNEIGGRSVIILEFALGLLVLSLCLGLVARWQLKRAGIPQGRVIHIDTNHLRPPEGTLYSANYSLVGRPDYLVNQGGRIIPIEVKSGAAPSFPYESHRYQLAGYGLLVGEHFGEIPPFGIIQYRDRSWEIPLSADLLEKTGELLEDIQADLSATDMDRSHQEPTRCRTCGFRAACGRNMV
jgi:CRISPR-associated exonuclease Cas4